MYYPLVICYIAIENDHLPFIVDFPIKNGESFHGYVDITRGYYFKRTAVGTFGTLPPDLPRGTAPLLLAIRSQRKEPDPMIQLLVKLGTEKGHYKPSIHSYLMLFNAENMRMENDDHLLEFGVEIRDVPSSV